MPLSLATGVSRKRASTAPTSAQAAPDPIFHGTGALPPVRRVLLADDDDDLRETMAELLREEGWEVVEARDGVETLERAYADRFDAIILDHRMPGLLGGEVYRRLRAQNNLVPVILVTAVGRLGELASSLGIPMFLAKPFRAEDLLGALHQVTGQAK